MQIPKIDLNEYQYILPETRIANHPLPERDHSKLLEYKNGSIKHFHFYNLPDRLPTDSLLVYNDTKVIPARLIFQKETGARIEIFLLKPISPSRVIPEVMLAKEKVVFETMIGNLRKWKKDEILRGDLFIGDQKISLFARLLDRDSKTVEFEWSDSNMSFVDVVEVSGEVPLPPYLNRHAEEDDKERYQTIYSKKEGAVAAPTAGLHFTGRVFDRLSAKGIEKTQLTLHVSAGTFQPIKVDKVENHPMHSEQILVTKETIIKLRKSIGKIIAVGTTSVRTLESIYWYGVKILENKGKEFLIPKLFPYKERKKMPSPSESLDAVLEFMNRMEKDEIMGSTEIFIFPGYHYQMVKALITNFHQPGSTLILLIATILGDDWKKVYEEALEKDYRFLSYGDSSLLWL